MKNTKRILALLLAGVITAGMTSCLKKAPEEAVTPGTSTDLEVEEGATLKVPAGAAEGKSFNMYLGYSGLKSSYVAEEETGDELNDAIYQRNKLTMEHLGLAEMNFVPSTRPTTGGDQQAETATIRTLTQAGDSTYDAYAHVQHSGMPTLIEEGMFVDWNEIPYINLENDWWYSNVQRDICFGSKVFCMTGDYNLSSFSGAECLIFNKTMCDELGLEYPYQMVFDGTWTHDKFVDYIKAATKDLNGDGIINRDDDRLGFGGWQYEQLQALFAGYGGECLTKDDNNMPILNVDNERTYTIVDKMIEVFDNEGAFFEGAKYGVDDKMFNEGRLLFNDSFISMVPGTRALEDIDVGFIPYPKLDEDQENYYSRTPNISCLTYIPVTNQDLDKTGAVLETLAYYSNDLVLPVYFDIILTIKSTRDTESEEMIPIIRNSARFLDQVVGFDGASIVTAKSGNTLSSLVASRKDVWEEKIATLAEIYE
ncbi:MAG: extracellular solute-binding protein [Clostridia bacterium]|nr:extracellular solute-binding protein [Clostridia bacterium]